MYELWNHAFSPKQISVNCKTVSKLFHEPNVVLCTVASVMFELSKIKFLNLYCELYLQITKCPFTNTLI